MSFERSSEELRRAFFPADVRFFLHGTVACTEQSPGQLFFQQRRNGCERSETQRSSKRGRLFGSVFFRGGAKREVCFSLAFLQCVAGEVFFCSRPLKVVRMQAVPNSGYPRVFPLSGDWHAFTDKKLLWIPERSFERSVSVSEKVVSVQEMRNPADGVRFWETFRFANVSEAGKIGREVCPRSIELLHSIIPCGGWTFGGVPLVMISRLQ
eukprot:RCo039386